jgi:hypothetical protein
MGAARRSDDLKLESLYDLLVDQLAQRQREVRHQIGARVALQPVIRLAGLLKQACGFIPGRRQGGVPRRVKRHRFQRVDVLKLDQRFLLGLFDFLFCLFDLVLGLFQILQAFVEIGLRRMLTENTVRASERSTCPCERSWRSRAQTIFAPDSKL